MSDRFDTQRAILHTKGIHPPAALNQEIEQLLPTKRYDSGEFIPNYYSFGGADPYALECTLKKLETKDEKDQFYSLYKNLHSFYSQYSGIQTREPHSLNLSFKYIAYKAAKIIYQQRKDPTVYQRIAILDEIIEVVLEGEKIKTLEVWNRKWSQISPTIDDSNPLKQHLNKILNLGYIPRYYEIVNPENVYVKASMSTLDLTPSNFEMVSSAKISDYITIIRQLRKEPNRSRLLCFSERGPLIIEGEQVKNINFRSYYWQSDNIACYGLPKYGWSNKKLFEAIKRFNQSTIESSKKKFLIPTYLMHPSLEKFSIEIKKIRSIQSSLHFIYQNAVIEEIETEYINFDHVVEYLDQIMIQYPELNLSSDDLHFYMRNIWKFSTLNGFQKNPYYIRSHYETIYRHLYRTTHFINWFAVYCKELVDEQSIRDIAWYDYGINEDLSTKSIIAIMSAPKSYLSIEIKSELLGNVEPIKMQPGSLLVSIQRQSENCFEPVQQCQYIEPIYQSMYNLCLNLEVTTENDLLQLRRYLALSNLLRVDLSVVNKDKLAIIIIKYLDRCRQAKCLI